MKLPRFEEFLSRGWRPFALALALGGAIAAGLWLIISLPESTELAVPRAELVQREGRWYRAGQTAPFTGLLVETYASGRLKARTSISNGLPEGLSEGYYTNGQIQVREYFRLGRSHGLRTKWHENGRQQAEAMVVDGKFEGAFRRWSESGALSEEIEMTHGKPNGVSRAYYPSGCLRAEVHLREGEVVEQRFWVDGERPLLFSAARGGGRQ